MSEEGTSLSARRQQWIDFARMIAILLVVFCHASERAYSYRDVESMQSFLLIEQVFAFAVHTLGRLGVPLFLLITGYLLLDREYDRERCVSFWKNSWLRLVVCTAIWIVIYEVFLAVVNHAGRGEIWRILARIIGRELYIFDTSAFAHTWYLPMIIGMYLMLPYMANGLRSIDVKFLWLPICVFTVVTFVYPTLALVTTALKLGGYSQCLSNGFSGGYHGIYIMMGYMVKMGELKKIKKGVLLLIASISFLVTIGLQLFVLICEYEYSLRYNIFPLIVCAVSLFELFSRMKSCVCPRFVGFMARYAFAVFLIHNLVKSIFLNSILALDCTRWVKLLLLWGIMMTLSYLLAAMLDRIPKLGKYLLYTK